MTPVVKRLAARDPGEPHRVSTPLELLFDLCFVVAVAQAASHLHHAMAGGHALQALPIYARIFFAIWWAWMNFTWFASAYDADDVPYRLAVLIQIAGVLLLAAGVARGFEQSDFTLMTFGYAVMRVGLISLWLRAGFANPPRRRTAFRFAAGIFLVELGWLAVLLLPAHLLPYAWLVGVPAELLIPVFAERAGATPWHPHHISERYGLLTLIVLGESVLAATNAIGLSLDGASFSLRFAGHIAGSVLIVFSMWWLYFDRPVHHYLRSNREGFIWGYGHYFVFAATAAVGAGLATASDFLAGRGPPEARLAVGAVAAPIVVYLISVWALQVRPLARGRAVGVAFFAAAALCYGACRLEYGVLAIGIILATLVAVVVARR